MKGFHEQRIINNVRSLTPAYGDTPNAFANPEHSARYARHSNSPKNLQELIHPTHPLFQRTFDQVTINTIWQNPMYSLLSAMVIVGDQTIIDTAKAAEAQGSSLRNVQSIYEYPLPVQLEFFGQIVSAEDALKQTIQGHFPEMKGMPLVVVTENVTPEVNSEEVQTGRSNILPHVIVFMQLMGETLGTESEAVPNRLFEQEMYQQLHSIHDIPRHIFHHMQTYLQGTMEAVPLFHIAHRTVDPHGYTLAVPCNTKQPSEQAKLLHAFNKAHAHAFQEVNVMLLESLQRTHRGQEVLDTVLLPQPSRRSYLHATDDHWYETDSLSLVATGVIENAGGQVHRHPQYAPHPLQQPLMDEAEKNIHHANTIRLHTGA